MKVAMSLRFDGRYIAHPYWPEREKLIDILKESGINRVRSMEKRERALSAYLVSHHLSQDQYHALEEKADQPFYTWADVLIAADGHNRAEIVIPAHQLYGCLAQTASICPAAMRIARVEQLRTVLHITDCATQKVKADGVFSRFVVVKLGTGQKASNQRSLRENPYIEQFTATGALHFLPGEDEKDERKLRDFMEYAGREIGVGASRKVGYGRFTVIAWKRLA